MTTYQMQILILLNEKKSLSKVAKAMYTTVQSITYQINSLQIEFDMKIITTSSKGTELTPAGLTLLTYSEKMLELYDKATKEINKSAIEINIGVDRVIVPPTIHNLKEVFNNTNTHYHVNFIYLYHLDELSSGLKDGIIDCFYSHKDKNDSLSFLPLFTDDVYLASAEHVIIPPGFILTDQDKSLPMICISNSPLCVNKDSYLLNHFSRIVETTDESIALYEISQGKGYCLTYGVYTPFFRYYPGITLTYVEGMKVEYGLYYSNNDPKIINFIDYLFPTKEASAI